MQIKYLFDKHLFQPFIYLKLCFSRTQSHLGFAFNLFDKFMLIIIWLELRGTISMPWMIILFVFITASFMIIGHFDLKLGLAGREKSLTNRYNPEIQEILRSVKK